MPTQAAAAKSAKVPKSVVYDEIEALLRRYSPPFTVCPPGKVGTKRAYGLWSQKEVEIAGRKHPAVYFASVIEQKDYVGFYYMPVYMDPKKQKQIAPRLLKMLKGKCCFHVKTMDAELLGQMKAILDLGRDCFKQSGWL